jgi:hypothetical protein
MCAIINCAISAIYALTLTDSEFLSQFLEPSSGIAKSDDHQIHEEHDLN